MKKLLMIILMVMCICACTPKETIDTNDPEPATDPAPQNDPEPQPEPVIVKETVYVLNNGWVTYDFDFRDELASYQLKDGLVLRFKGETRSEPYCQDGECIVYDEVMANDTHLELYETMDLKLNEDYGRLYLYNLNDQLYLLAFDPAAQYSSYRCIVFRDTGEVVETFEGVALTMNTEYQNQFMIDYLGEAGTITKTQICTAEGPNLKITDF